MYVAKPDTSSVRAKEKPTSAIIYLVDVFGIELVENRLFVPPPLSHTLTLLNITNPPPASPTASPALAT